MKIWFREDLVFEAVQDLPIAGGNDIGQKPICGFREDKELRQNPQVGAKCYLFPKPIVHGVSMLVAM